MNEYVAECRREWRRLGVPNSVADEMAAELEADLSEAPSLDEALGPDAADARAFARRWALERGVVPSARRRLRVGAAAALAAFALVAIAGALLMVFSSPRSERLALRTVPQPASVGPQRVWSGPPARVTLEPVPTIAVRAPVPPLVRVVSADDSGVDADSVGLVLLVAGLAGFLPLALLASRRIALDR